MVYINPTALSHFIGLCHMNLNYLVLKKYVIHFSLSFLFALVIPLSVE